MLTSRVTNNNFNLSMEEEVAIASPQLRKPPTIPLPKATNIAKQGIGSILGTEKSSAASIRRTFSADMSSKQWLAQNGFFSPMKKVASSKDLAVENSSPSEEDNELKSPKMYDVWSPILSQKKDNDDNSNLETPYIHPLVKRSTSSLSEKSLEICTESLGSETGSDHGFSSSYTIFEIGEIDEEEKDDQQQYYNPQSFEELRAVKYNYTKRSCFPRSFPPAISSLARGGDNRPSLHMQSRRHDGGLILEAVSVSSRNLFHARRRDGRLLLTFIDNTTLTSSSEQEMEENDEVFDDIDEGKNDQTPQFDYNSEECNEEEGQIENGIKGMDLVTEQNPRLSNGVMIMKTSALMMKILDSPVEIREKSIQFLMETDFHKFSPELEGHVGLGNKNLGTWLKFNKVVDLMSSMGSTELMEGLSKITSVPQSLPAQLNPSRATTTNTASFNAYEYFWRKKPTASIVNTNQIFLAVNSTSPNATSTTNIAAYEQQELVLLSGNKANMNYLVTFQHRGCKETRKSLLIWEPYCIATS